MAAKLKEEERYKEEEREKNRDVFGKIT